MRDSAIPIPAAAPARARLEAELAQLRDRGSVRSHFGFSQWALAAVTTAVAVLGVTWLLAADAAGPRSPDVEGTLRVFLLPNGELTPGVARPVTVAEVCGQEQYGRTQPIAAAVHQTVFARYGADVRRASEYELDHLITPELGGVPDPRNLWPQAFTGTAWNAYVKDELELHLHQLVCEGAIDLMTAQREIATDWIASYKRHFDTDTPRRNYAIAPLSEDDTDLLRAELEELGIDPPTDRADGPTLMALLQNARGDLLGR